MKRVSGRRMCAILKGKGWALDHVNGSHHIFKKPGNPLSISVPVHGNKTLKTGTQKAIMKAAGLTNADL